MRARRQAARSQAGRLQHEHRSPRMPLVTMLAAVLALALTLAACGINGSQNVPPYTVPANWHDVTPPTSDPLATYAISPDVPGLIVACIGSKTGNMSASPLSPATLWRTRDGGAHWQRLAGSGYLAGCEVAFPAGGSGTLFVLNLDGGQFIQVSHDAGDTWKTIAHDTGAPYGAIQQRFALLAHGVYRDGRLYTDGQADTPAAASAAAAATASTLNPPPAGGSPAPARADIGVAFSVSVDDSQTWTAVEAAPDPLLEQGYVPLAIAADYRAPGAWFRLLGPRYSSSYGGSDALVLEHSTDGGQTWQPRPIMSIGDHGTYWGLADGGLGMATLATEPGQPARLCAALSPQIFAQSASLPSAPGPFGLGADAAGSVLRGPPAPIPHDVALAGSDDGGQTWSAAIISKHQSNYDGYAADPGVAMDPHGNCYLAEMSGQGGDTTTALISIWRLSPGSGATPAVIARITSQSIAAFAISLDSATHAPRLVAVAKTYTGLTEIICQGDVCPPEPPIPPSHLIWAPAP